MLALCATKYLITTTAANWLSLLPRWRALAMAFRYESCCSNAAGNVSSCSGMLWAGRCAQRLRAQPAAASAAVF